MDETDKSVDCADRSSTAEQPAGAVAAAERTEKELSVLAVLDIASRLESTFDPGGNLPDDCEVWASAHMDLIGKLRGMCECVMANDDEDYSG